MNILEALAEPALFGNTFQGDTWGAWHAVLSATFAIPMDETRAATFKRLAGGREPPTKRVRELWVVAGRRSAKTQTAAAVAVYLATVGAELGELRKRLSPGELGVIALLATDRNQAKVILGYIRALLEDSPALHRMVIRADTEGVSLSNRVDIQVHTSSYRAIRGRTLLAVVLDECAFFRSDLTANPDVEIYRAALPGLATLGGLLIGISSPYAKRGLLYSKYQRHFGKDDDVLVVQGATADFNPTIQQHIIDEALADDPEAASAEWLGQFRSDISSFIDRDLIAALTRSSPLEIPSRDEFRYEAFVDPAGGGRDEYCLAIGHREGECAVVDVLRAMSGQPADITKEYAALLKSYRINSLVGDRYAGSWPADEFRKHHIDMRHSELAKSELYQHLLAVLNSGRVELPPDMKLINQFAALERRTSRGGRDVIDHPMNGHDDRPNVVAGLCHRLLDDRYAGCFPIEIRFSH